MSVGELHNEKDLLARIANGDESAMNSIFQYYFGRLVIYAFRLVQNKAEAEDMTMRVLGKLWERKSTDQRIINALDSFLYRSVHNHCIDYLRHEKVIMKQRSYVNETNAETEDYIENNYIRAELISFIYEEMDNLPDKCGEVVKLYFIHEMSHAEIAAKMNIEEKTVRNQKARALTLLRSALIKKGLLHLIFYFF